MCSRMYRNARHGGRASSGAPHVRRSFQPRRIGTKSLRSRRARKRHEYRETPLSVLITIVYIPSDQGHPTCFSGNRPSMEASTEARLRRSHDRSFAVGHGWLERTGGRLMSGVTNGIEAGLPGEAELGGLASHPPMACLPRVERRPARRSPPRRTRKTGSTCWAT